MALTDKLTAIANAIRAKTGKTAKMTMTEMVTEIGELSNASAYTTNTYLTEIATNAYINCNSISQVKFENVTSIGNSAFQYCYNLRIADFPAATKIGTYAFNNCSNMEALILRNTTQVCSLAALNALYYSGINNRTGYIYVPDALVDSYKAATNWSTYAAQIKPLSEYTGG